MDTSNVPDECSYAVRASDIRALLLRATITERAQLRNSTRIVLRKGRFATACLFVSFFNLCIFLISGSTLSLACCAAASAGAVAGVRDAKWQYRRIASALATLERRP